MLALLVAALSLQLAGCWDRAELDQISIIGAIGLDKGENGKVIVSLELVNPRALASTGMASNGAATRVASLVLRDEAETISCALASAQTRTPRALSTGQVSSIICGQALAREGIGPYLDYLLRDARVRNSSILATCDTGAGLLQRPIIEPLASHTLLGLAQTALNSGKTVRVTLNEFAVKLAEPGVEPVTMHTVGRKTKDIEVKHQGEEVKQAEKADVREQPIDADITPEAALPSDSPYLNPLKESGTGQMVPGMTIDIGIAAYKGDKLVGLLDGVQARGFLWLSGRLHEATLDVIDPFGSGKIVSLDVVRAKSSIKPVFGEGKHGVKMKAEIHVDLEASQFQLGTDLRQPGIVDALESSLDAIVEQEVRSTLQRVQTELKSDIYGFGFEVYKANPKFWAGVEGTWNDEVFPDLEVELKIKTRVRAPGFIYGLDEHGLFK